MEKRFRRILIWFNDYVNNTVTKKSRTNISVTKQSKINFKKDSKNSKKKPSRIGIDKNSKSKWKMKEEDDFFEDDYEESFSEYSDASGSVSKSHDCESEY